MDRRLAAWAVGGAVLLFSLVTYVNTRDPTIVVLAAMLLAGIALFLWLARFLEGAVGGVRVRCLSCATLNPEAARFCHHCGQAMVPATATSAG